MVHQHFIDEDSPAAEELRALHAALSVPSAADGVTRDALAQATGLTPVKLRVGLEQLEAAGALRRMPDEGYDLLRVEAEPLPEQALRELGRQATARRQHKRRQLDLMVGYADTEACRRETLLRHFGDDGPPDAEGEFCCDNCAREAAPEAALPSDGRKAETRAERAALIVLDTLRHLPWAVGKGKLAQVLKGHASMAETEYARARNFGKLAPLTLASIEGLIGEMTTARYLRTTGGSRPVLALTAAGERALDGRLALPVGTALGEAVNTAKAARATAPRQAPGATMALSGELLARGLRPDEIAAERGLAVGTIYSHLAQLIAEGKVDVNAVVPAEVQAQVRAAARAEGSLARLAPLKARLPAELGYDVIRCVVEAMKREEAGDVERGA
jgi:superfamily II DNA helicase RecQ